MITISRIQFLVLVFLICSISSVKAATSSTVPEVVIQGMEDVVEVYFEKAFGTGFVVRNPVTGTPILFTAYHVVKGFEQNQSGVEAFTVEEKQLKIKRLLSYSKKLDLVLFELESYEGTGLKLAKHPVYDKTLVYILGYSGYITQQKLVQGTGFHLPELVQGTSFHLPAHKTLSTITGSGAVVGGMSGSPVLNSNGEVIGIFSHTHRLYKHHVALKTFYLNKFMSESIPQERWSISHSISSLFSGHPFSEYPFLSKPVFSQLQQLADAGSVDAQNMLRRISKGVLLESGGSFLIVASVLSVYFTIADLNMSHYFVGFVSFALSSNSCRNVFRYIRNKRSVRQ